MRFLFSMTLLRYRCFQINGLTGMATPMTTQSIPTCTHPGPEQGAPTIVAKYVIMLSWTSSAVLL